MSLNTSFVYQTFKMYLIVFSLAEKEQDVLYDVVFDEEFLGGLTLR